MNRIFPLQFSKIKADFRESSETTKQNFGLILTRLENKHFQFLEAAFTSSKAPVGNFPLISKDFTLEICNLELKCNEIIQDTYIYKDWKFDTEEPIPIWLYKFVVYIWEICDELSDKIRHENINIDHNKFRFGSKIHIDLLEAGTYLLSYVRNLQLFLGKYFDSYYKSENIPISERLY